MSNEEQNGNFAKPMLADSLPPSELIVLKEYYDKKWKGANGCRSKEKVDAQTISRNIEKLLDDMVANFR